MRIVGGGVTGGEPSGRGSMEQQGGLRAGPGDAATQETGSATPFFIDFRYPAFVKNKVPQNPLT